MNDRPMREEMLADTLKSVCDRMDEIALEWRGDWSDFDGRTLLHQVTDITDPARQLLAELKAEA